MSWKVTVSEDLVAIREPEVREVSDDPARRVPDVPSLCTAHRPQGVPRGAVSSAVRAVRTRILRIAVGATQHDAGRTTMTPEQIGTLIDKLERVGLAKTSDYTCEGTPEQVRDNPSGTMVLIHPGIMLASDGVEGVEAEEIPAGGQTRDGMFATGVQSPESILPPLFESDDSWQYLFVEWAGDELA